jgi:hypothetical protein
MSDGAGYDRVYRRVLGIGLLVSLVVHGAILAWGRLNVTAASDDRAEPTTQLALAYVDEQPVELIDVRVAEADVAAETAPVPESETSTVEAALDIEPPKLAMATEGSMIAVSLVEADDSDVGDAIDHRWRRERLRGTERAAARQAHRRWYQLRDRVALHSAVILQSHRLSGPGSSA